MGFPVIERRKARTSTETGVGGDGFTGRVAATYGISDPSWDRKLASCPTAMRPTSFGKTLLVS
jgi:hypothetical protein